MTQSDPTRDPVDALRERLRAALASAVIDGDEIECPHCRGTGRVVRTRRTVTQTDVAEAIGTQRTSIATFLAGRQGFTMPVTLRLIEWLDALEGAPDDSE